MSGKMAVSAAALALALLAGGCKGYETQGSAQVAGPEPVSQGVNDPVYRSSSGVHGDHNTLDDRSGTLNASGHRRGAREQ
jgi:hypothetical protein